MGRWGRGVINKCRGFDPSANYVKIMEFVTIGI